VLELNTPLVLVLELEPPMLPRAEFGAFPRVGLLGVPPVEFEVTVIFVCVVVVVAGGLLALGVEGVEEEVGFLLNIDMGLKARVIFDFADFVIF